MKNAILALALLLAPALAAAQDLDRPLMLVAAPELEGPYRHSTLIVVPAGDDRHVGVIVNRAAPMQYGAAPLYYGGPEGIDSLFILVRGDPGSPAQHLFGDVFFSGDAATIERVLAAAPETARVFAGFVGWNPGELADEIEEGYWYVAEPDAAQVFSSQPGETVWAELVKRLGRRLQTRLE